MDILISSNLERLIYLSAGCNSDVNKELMEELSKDGRYTVTEEMSKNMKDFCGGYATEAENAAVIRKLFKDTGYVIDTHTGVAAAVYQEYKKETGDTQKTVIASTASPYKFSRSVMEAISSDDSLEHLDEFEIVDRLHEISGMDIPQAVEEIRSAAVRYNMECDKDQMKETVARILDC